ncbi:MAG TPA: hypothetical protein VFG68_05040 [Fimbriiglobus sp.]|nr:hypothetical protein [Fimbriiglobus sp.]
MHFEKESAVFQTMEKISRRLTALGIAHAVAGGMAMFQHGYRRFTEDVDILVTRDGLKALHDKLVGLGYVPSFEGSKNLRDAETGVRVEFLVAGDYPGDGKPKPVVFPDPAAVGIEVGGVQCVSLPALIELKLTSGTAAWRLKDLADVQEMIRVLGLSDDFADRLHPTVRDKFRELAAVVRDAPHEPE